MSTSDDDRIAYLAGEDVEGLDAGARAELDELRELLSAPATWVEPGDELEDRVLAAIAAEVAAVEARAVAPAPPAPAKPDRSATARWRLPRLTLPRLGMTLAGAAAVVVAAIVIASGSSSSGPKPLQFAMVVEGTPLAPGAHGHAHLTKTASGWRIQLNASGLPHLDDGRYYEAWLRNAAGILVPVGTFNDARSVTLWSGVPVTQFQTLTVTQQVANGDPASSGQKVLIGTISHGG